MMEFFLSKFWAFLVSMVIMAVLVQGMQLDARMDRNEALNDLAGELERMFDDLAEGGPGLEVTIELARVLPPTAILTLNSGYASLQDQGGEVLFTVPAMTMNLENEHGDVAEVE
ncbi:MAG TPA: hypothetical protein PKN85_10455, partial [Syntrophorhabdaceae bacterium]|nr:hypothetical protein [Syntrophorhabdaceae bacterium]